MNPGLTLANYLRTITTAEGLSSGPVTFEMHAGNTGPIGAPCTSLHTINTTTSTITVRTAGGTTGLPAAAPEVVKLWFDGPEQLGGAGLEPGPCTVSVREAMGRTVAQRTMTILSGAFEMALPESANGILLVVADQESTRIERRLMWLDDVQSS